MKKLLLILGVLGAVGGGIWALTKWAGAAECVAGVTECRGGDLWVCFGMEGLGGGSTDWMLFEANSPFCIPTGAVGSIVGVTLTQDEEPLDGVLVIAYNHSVSPGWVGKISKCPAAPGGVASLPECFRFDNLPIGTYTVNFVKEGYITAEKQASVTEGIETYVIGTMVAG